LQGAPGPVALGENTCTLIWTALRQAAKYEEDYPKNHGICDFSAA
jgi:hypothetical protein